MLRQREAQYERVLDDAAVERHLADVDSSPERSFSDRQFALPERPFPAKEIALGACLLLGGCLVALLGLLNLAGLWHNETAGAWSAAGLCARRRGRHVRHAAAGLSIDAPATGPQHGPGVYEAAAARGRAR